MSLAGGDLTTLARMQVWLPDVTSGPASAILAQLISSASQQIRSQIMRPYLGSRSYTRSFDGSGTGRLVLPDWPVTKVATVQVESVTIPPAPAPAPSEIWPLTPFGYGFGYRYAAWDGGLPGDPAVLELLGGRFWRGRQSISVTYNAGYLVQSEPATVPGSPYAVTVLQPMGLWSGDGGVVYAGSGNALTAVAATPAVGQYVPPGQSEPGLYTFAAADQGAALLVSYSFIPADLEEACIQLVAERYSYRGRVGQRSKSLGGNETMTFDRSGIAPEILSLIAPYRSVIPRSSGTL